MANRADQGADGDFAVALRAAIADRGLSLDRIRYHLAVRGHEVSVATLSYWQSGRSRPERARSLAALATLEEVLEVPPGSLASRLTPRRPRSGAVGDHVDGHTTLTDAGSIMDRLVRQAGMTWADGLERIAVQDLLDINADGTEGPHTVRELLRAERPGADRFPQVYQYDDVEATGWVSALKNCRLGRTVSSRAHRIIVTELLLERPLHVGESILVEYRLQQRGQRSVSTQWERGCLRTMREMHLEVRFAPERLPVSAEKYTVVNGQTRSEPLLLTGNVITVVHQDFGPGVTGMRWSW